MRRIYRSSYAFSVLTSSDKPWRQILVQVSSIRPGQVKNRKAFLKDLRAIFYSFHLSTFYSSSSLILEFLLLASSPPTTMS